MLSSRFWIYRILANRVPTLPKKNFMSLRHPSGHFTLHKIWQDHACVKNLPWVGGEVCAEFDGDWSGGSGVKRGHRYVYRDKQSLLYIENSQPGPVLPGKNLMSLCHSSGHFMLHKVFSPVIRLGFRVLGTLGSKGWVGRVMLVLRTFPELVGRSVQNLVEIGPAVRAWKGDTGMYIGTNSHFYIDRLANRAPALPRKLIKQYKGTHLDILHYKKFFSPVIRLSFRVWGTPGLCLC